MAPPTDMVLVGRILREARFKAGLRQGDVAVKVGILQTHVSRLELGQIADPGIRILVRLCEALDIDLADLIEPLRSESGDDAVVRRHLARVAS